MITQQESDLHARITALEQERDELKQELIDAQAGCIACGNGGFVEIEGQKTYCRCPIGERDRLQADVKRLTLESEAYRTSLSECHSYLSLLRYRAENSIQWGGPGLLDKTEVDHALGRAEKVLYPKG